MAEAPDLNIEQIQLLESLGVQSEYSGDRYIWRDGEGTILVKFYFNSERMWCAAYHESITPKPFLFWSCSKLERAIDRVIIDLFKGLKRRGRSKAYRR